MTVAELELLRARIPGAFHVQDYAADVVWWNAERQHLLETVAFCKAALARGSMVPRAKAAELRAACDDLVARAQELAVAGSWAGSRQRERPPGTAPSGRARSILPSPRVDAKAM